MRIIEMPGHIPDTSNRISMDALRLAIEGSGIEYLVTLPESPYEVLLRELLKSSFIKIIQVCRESEGMSICSGLTYGGKVAALLCSYKGSITRWIACSELHCRPGLPFSSSLARLNRRQKRSPSPWNMVATRWLCLTLLRYLIMKLRVIATHI
jgi:hypothetical protein